MNTNSSFALERILEAYQEEEIQSGKYRYLAVYRAIKRCIDKKEIPENWLLPSSRVLAERLGLSRTTVNTAFELLQLEKLIYAKAGSGHRVCQTTEEQPKNPDSQMVDSFLFPGLSDLGQSVLNNVGILNRAPDVGIAFKPGLPPIDIFPINRWKNLLNSYWRHIRSSDLSYGQSAAAGHLKQQICDYLYISRSIRVHPEQVVAVSGSLQSLYFIASALINPGDAVVLENPTFPNVHSIFKSFRAQIHAVVPDEEGMNPGQSLQLDKIKPKLIHVTPSDHYPLGIKMSLQRRLDILKQASSCQSLIIENDYEHEIANYKQSMPTLFSLDKEQRTIYLGTFNRLLYPSIRLGFMLLPPHLVPVMKAFEEHSYRFVSPSLQMVMGQFIERNYLYQHFKNLCEAAEERATLFRDLFTEGNRHLYLMQTEFNSLHFVAPFIQIGTAKKEEELIRELAIREISAFPLSNCFIGEPKQFGLILGYSTVRPSALRQKMILLKDVLTNLDA